MKTEERIDLLREWGCDTQGALERILNDRDLYFECLSAVAADENFSAVEGALQAQDADAAFSALHALRGVFANLGLTRLEQKALEMLGLLKENDYAALMRDMAELWKLQQRLCEITENDTL